MKLYVDPPMERLLNGILWGSLVAFAAMAMVLLSGCAVNEQHANACVKACGVGNIESISPWECKCRVVAGALALPPVRP